MLSKIWVSLTGGNQRPWSMLYVEVGTTAMRHAV